MKTCTKCLKIKPLSEFHKAKDRYGKDGYYSQCKQCKSEYWKEWREANPELARAKDIRSNANRGNLSIKDRQQLFQLQDGKCAICKTPGLMYGEGTPKDTLPLDHDHVTGHIRGLLCIKCNRGLGLFKDNPDLLREAASYVERGGILNYGEIIREASSSK